MPALRNTHRRRALFEQDMADRSASNMARIIHQRLAILHSAAADARSLDTPQEGQGH